MLSVMGGLWVMSGSAPLAAQGAAASATRSFSPATAVAPGATVTVTIAATGYGSLGGVTETLPAGFAYVSGGDTTGVSAGAPQADTADGRKVVRFTLQGADRSFSYVVTASSVEGDHAFEGTLTDEDRGSSDVGGDASILVSATPVTPGPAPEKNDLQFDVVSGQGREGCHGFGSGQADWKQPSRMGN